MGLNSDVKKKKTAGGERLSEPETRGGYRCTYRGLDAAQRIFDGAKGGKTLVYYDPDVDGLVAGMFITRVLAKLGIGWRAHANSQRAHGFLLRDDEYQGWSIFNGDFLVPRKKVQGLVKNGTSILSLDHHELEDEGFIHEVGSGGAEGVVINNQYEWEDKENHYQSGAGVTFEVLRELYPWMDTGTNRAMVGMSLLSDIRNIHNERAAGYLYELYNHKYEGYIRYLMQTAGVNTYKFGVPRMTRNYVDFSLSPKINSMLRFNEENKAVKYILGGGCAEVEYQKMQKEFLEELTEVAEITEYSHLVVIKVRETDVREEMRGVYSNFIGLLCSKDAGGGRSAVGYAEGEGVVRASFRGNLQETGYRREARGIVDGRGHEIAFGVINLDAREETFIKLNEACKRAEKNSQYRQRYLAVPNMQMFIKNGGRLLADYNNYRMSSDRVHIRYTGESAEVVRSGVNYTEYNVDGYKVMCFDKSLDIKEDYIVASLDSKQVEFVLQEKWNEKYAKRVTIDSVDLSETWWKNL